MEGPALLVEFLKANKLTVRDFGGRIRAPFSLVWRWTRGQQPSIDDAHIVQRATGGRVPVRSWVTPSIRGRASRLPRNPSDSNR